MRLTVNGSVTVATKPFALEGLPGEPLTVAFVAAAEGIGIYSGQRLDVERLPMGDVVCRGDLATRALEFRMGERVFVRGALEIIGTPLDAPGDDGSVRLSILAEELVAE